MGGLLSSCVNSPRTWLDSDWVSISSFGEVQGQDTGSTANPSMKHQTSDDVDIAARSEGGGEGEEEDRIGEDSPFKKSGEKDVN